MLAGHRGATPEMIDPIVFVESAFQPSYFLTYRPSDHVGKESQNG
jgi:hypothetical protein